MKESKTLNFLLDIAYGNTFGCDLCRVMGWKCPFDPNIDEDQDPEGTICRNFLQEQAEKAIKEDFSLAK